jgi:putative ABC transport system permease protein
MNSSVYQISFLNLLWIAIPVFAVIVIFLRWSLGVSSVLHGLARMVLQLILIGYALNYIFSSDQPLVVVGILCIMLVAAGMIALRPVRRKRRSVYLKALLSISAGGILTLIIVTQGVISLDPWYEPHYVIPLAGMIFANSMNAVSLAAERYEVEIERENDHKKARSAALQAALIPITNSLFAVGIVSLPGMMTGQILSGISPLIAARYQIMVMCMIFGSAGISTESGISDFRSPGGVWERYRMVNYQEFLLSSESRKGYWRMKHELFKELKDARPNAAHKALAEMEKLGKLKCLITQNIDGLHQDAGNSPERVIELHGTNREAVCLECRKRWPIVRRR